MARVTAQQLLTCLNQSNFVVLKKPPTPLSASKDIPGYNDNK